MKVKKSQEIELEANTGFTIPLNSNLKSGDTLAREVVLAVDGEGTVTITDSDSNTVKVINGTTFDVENYSGGKAMIMADALDEIVITSTTAATLTYSVIY